MKCPIFLDGVCLPPSRMAQSARTMPSDPSPPPHGLATPQDLTWAGRIRLALRRQSRAFYRSVGHPRNRRKGRLRAWLALKVRNRGLWRPSRNAVAAGMAGGLFFSMMPIPLQGFVVAVIGMARGWNLPSAIAATWVSNPFTYIPMLVGAKYSITGVCALFGHDCAAGQLSMERLGEIWGTAVNLELMEAWQMAGPALLQILLGMIILGILFAVAGWVIVHLSWTAVEKRSATKRCPRTVN